MPKFQVTLKDVQQARKVLSRVICPTPLLYNGWLSDKFGCQIYLKLETMQPIGSFKIRGATYKISKLTPSQRKRGVVATSLGNHAQGVAWGSRKFRTKATIFMPIDAPLTKVQQTSALGAEVVLVGTSLDEARVSALKFSKKTGAIFIHPYEDPDVIAGQGTIALEILEQLPSVEVVLGAMGGGGMMTGISTVLKTNYPAVKTIGLQALGARSLVDSIRKGRLVDHGGRTDTFADGIKVAHASQRMLHLLTPILDEVGTASDEEIAAAVLMLMEKAKIVAEGSGAIPLAALSQFRDLIRKKNVVLIISGGNIDVNVIARIIDRGLIQSGRRVRVNVWIKDKPGSLNRLTDMIAKQNGNVLQVIHDRDIPSTGLDETGVELTLETRGAAHSRELIRALRLQVERLELLH